jgi:hypothetical protein
VKRGLPPLLLAACLASAGAVRAEELAPNPAAATEKQDAAWTARLGAAEARRNDAVQRVIAGEAAFTRARHREYPRGEALAGLARDLEKARKDLAAAEQELPELLEEARRAGVSPAVLDRFEPASE